MYRADGHVRDSVGGLSDLEKNIENKAVKDRDAELLKKLRDSLKLKPHEAIPDNVAEKLQDTVKKDKK